MFRTGKQAAMQPSSTEKITTRRCFGQAEQLIRTIHRVYLPN